VGEAEGTPYFVMSYADRGTVANLLERQRTVPIERTLDLVSQAGAGLNVLHAQGSIHRDIKPANLLLRTDGSGQRLMVADLGVAKAILHASGLTHVVGTPAYMAPEQATGGGIDERADVYALAAVTYHMLTGALAHTGSIADLAQLQPPAPPSGLSGVSTDVDEVVLRGLAPDREERWPDIRSFIRALQAVVPTGESTLLVSPPELGSASFSPSTPTPVPAAGAPARSGSRLLLVLACLAAFVVCFGGALAATEQLH
jgi:serine/threonine protein kinase